MCTVLGVPRTPSPGAPSPLYIYLLLLLFKKMVLLVLKGTFPDDFPTFSLVDHRTGIGPKCHFLGPGCHFLGPGFLCFGSFSSENALPCVRLSLLFCVVVSDFQAFNSCGKVVGDNFPQTIRRVKQKSFSGCVAWISLHVPN